MKKNFRIFIPAFLLALLCAFLFSAPAFGESGGTQVVKTSLFSAAFPKESLGDGESGIDDSPMACSIHYILQGKNKAQRVEITISAHLGEALDYRAAILRLEEVLNKTALDETIIGGVLFSYAEYEYGNSLFMEYAARVPESSTNLWISIRETPGAQYDYQPILDSISFTLPLLPSSCKADPPLYQDSEPFKPQTGKAYIGGMEITASWLPMDTPLLFSHYTQGNIALHHQTLYILTGRRLYEKQIEDGRLIAGQVFPEGVLKLDDDYGLMSMAGDGTLYVTNTVLKNFSVRDGIVNQINESSIGSLAVHPGGEWGISLDGQGNPSILHITPYGFTSENFALRNPRDPKKTRGRFGHITCLRVYEDRVYVSGIDTTRYNITAVSAFDLAGNELFTFGSGDYTDPEGLSFVTNIAQTQKSIVILDPNLDSLKVLTLDGTFIGTVNCGELLGTKHAYVFSIAPAEDGLMLATAQTREDGSLTELLIFHITGL